MNKKTIILVVVAVLVVAAIVIFAVISGTKAPASSAGAATSTQTLGGQIYNNVAPQAAVPQSLPQVNPFGQ